MGTEWRADFSTFMINRPILHGSDWWKFRFQNMVTGCIQSSFSMQMSIKGAEGQGEQRIKGCRGSRRAEGLGCRGSRGAEGQQVDRFNRCRSAEG